MKYDYAIIDTNEYPYKIYHCRNLEEAKVRCYYLRKERYADGDMVKEIQYDNMKCDMFYNVVKISENIF